MNARSMVEATLDGNLLDDGASDARLDLCETAEDRERVRVFNMLRESALECEREGRDATPLHRYKRVPPYRDVPQKWRDDAAEHLAVKRDARA